MNLAASLKHCLRNLARFDGRDAPGQFWPYTLILIGGVVVSWMVFMVGAMSQAFERMQRFAEEHPDQATVTRGPGSYSIQIEGHHPELMPDMTPMIGVMAVIVSVFVILVAAAVVRRLHDSDMRGWPALVPLALLASGLAMMARMFGSFGRVEGPDMSLFMWAFANNIVYLASLGWLIYLLARRGTPTDNRFGPPPATA